MERLKIFAHNKARSSVWISCPQKIKKQNGNFFNNIRSRAASTDNFTAFLAFLVLNFFFVFKGDIFEEKPNSRFPFSFVVQVGAKEREKQFNKD